MSGTTIQPSSQSQFKVPETGGIVRNLREENAHLKVELAKARVINERLAKDALNTQNKNLTTALSVKDSALTKLTEQNKALEERVATLVKQMQDHEDSKSSSSSSKTPDAAKQSSKSDSKAKSLQKELQSKEALKKNNQALKREITIAQNVMKKLREELFKTENSKQELQSQLNSTKEDFEKNSREFLNAKNSCEKKDRELVTLTQKNEALQLDLSKAKTTIANAKILHEKALQKVTRLTKILNEKNTQIQQLKKKSSEECVGYSKRFIEYKKDFETQLDLVIQAYRNDREQLKAQAMQEQRKMSNDHSEIVFKLRAEIRQLKAEQRTQGFSMKPIAFSSNFHQRTYDALSPRIIDTFSPKPIDNLIPSRK